ncbi:MAG: alpha/beta hydrolase [Luteimonas sp.]|nr:alpha/beta hydrolase [Luteimonas sp.]
MTQRVLLLHGIWNAKAWLAPLASRLRAGGFVPEILGYPSVFSSPDATVPQLIKRLSAGEETAIVGHSLGGMMALEALRCASDLPVTRVVCLGSPLRGSHTARQVGGRLWTAPVLGRSAGLLQRGFERWDGTVEVGMVAGNVPHGLGRLFAAFEGESDGTVTIEETRLPGLADHCIVASSHSGLVFSADAARQAMAFLRNGSFEHSSTPGAPGSPAG